MSAPLPTERQVQRAILGMVRLCFPATDLPSILRYEGGKLFWLPREPHQFPNDAHPEGRCRTFNKQFAGKEAFTAINKGYRVGRIYDRIYQAHRVVWALHNGSWPTGQIDHINGDPSDNRLENLRDVSNAENHRNERRPRNNTSGTVGVCLNKRRGVWRAHIKVNYRQIHLGVFDLERDAINARRAAEVRYGFHANHGRSA